MTGGPGCSSELAVFYENGPYFILDNLTLAERQYSWNAEHNMIYIDQPVWTGFSYSLNNKDTEYNERQVAQDMYEFLQEFLQVHPLYLDNEFFVTGESYGGHYVPSVSFRIFEANKNEEGPININLKGFAIGDGFVDPAAQFGSMADFLYGNDLITKQEVSENEQYLNQCQKEIAACNNGGSKEECTQTNNYCWDNVENKLIALTNDMNPYDITKKCIDPLCYDFSDMNNYLALHSTRVQLGVGERHWTECNMTVNSQFSADMVKSMAHLFPPMLDAGIRVNLYFGTNDWICNWVGGKRWVDALEWSGSEQWASAEEVEWGGRQEQWICDGDGYAGRTFVVLYISVFRSNC
eukprot:TRINITY_DN2432_c0_g2_i1.p1 TRINITY_DN2432_c0_g2~~TRINITY_DN2432_c0_g2_i1.p1  ORF type:complete len:351 (+),score=30.23 TRINITY_DN2432_c0_g2_i1:372-1424(+)